MPNWNELSDTLKNRGSTTDGLRREWLRKLERYTKRNTIIYYSGWLQANLRQSDIGDFAYSINDTDKNAFMSVVHKLDTSKGLDLLIHSPGGSLGAVESLIHYLRSKFDKDIRAFVPQIAMSAGTMLACSCREIHMGRQSNIGPFDPQMNGMPVTALIEEMKEVIKAFSHEDRLLADGAARFWQPIYGKLHPSFIKQAEHVFENTNQIMEEFLKGGMLSEDLDKDAKAKKIVEYLGDIKHTRFHGRHIHKEKARELGLKVVDLEEDQKLQELVLTLHHTCMLSFERSPCLKIIENHKGTSVILNSGERSPY